MGIESNISIRVRTHALRLVIEAHLEGVKDLSSSFYTDMSDIQSEDSILSKFMFFSFAIFRRLISKRSTGN